MFASVELARRIETAEARMMSAIGTVVRRDCAPGVFALEPLGGGVALFVRPDSPMNKAIGFGFDGALDAVALDRVEALWRARGEPLRCEVATLARCEVLQQLADRGYGLRAFENVLGCAPAAGTAPAAFAVEPVGPDLSDAWVDGIADAFLQPDGTGAGSPDAFARDECVASLRQSCAVAGMRRYAVRIDGTLAGGASMRIDEGGIAQLTGAATLPPFRRRGVQAALLRARLRDAAQAGCDVAVITTQPGSMSQGNAQRQGFSLLYARAILVLPPA